ncbi:MAG: hypothetical protein ABR552_00670 [Actinomycetota bacterium]|nr:hypothetical protein [Actinomycetota bacterium]
MPRWLRYLVSVSSALMTYFIFVVLVGGIAIATHQDRQHLNAGLSILALLGSFFVPSLVMLLINDWVADRYPAATKPAGSVPERVEH